LNDLNILQNYKMFLEYSIIFSKIRPMYGLEFQDPNAQKGTTFVAGENKVTLKSFAIEPVNSANYQGDVLDIIFVNNEGDEYRHRIFPVDKASIPASYQKYLERMTKSTKAPLSQDDFAKMDLYAKVNTEIKTFVAEYISEEQFNESLKAWVTHLKTTGTEPTFELFVGFCAGVLRKYRPDFAKVEAKIVLGYKKNSQYLSIPTSVNYNCNQYITTNPDIELKVLGGNYSMNKPDRADKPGGYNVSTPADNSQFEFANADAAEGLGDDMPF
jgi:hypothetical protein